MSRDRIQMQKWKEVKNRTLARDRPISSFTLPGVQMAD